METYTYSPVEPWGTQICVQSNLVTPNFDFFKNWRNGVWVKACSDGQMGSRLGT